MGLFSKFNFFLLSFLFLSLFTITASADCDGRFSDPNALLRIYDINGNVVKDYEFGYVSSWCVAENVLLAYSDTEILVQTSESTLTVYDISESENELVEIRIYRHEFNGYGAQAIVNNSILHNQVLFDLETGKTSGLPLRLDEIEANNLTHFYSSLKVDENHPQPRLIVTANYNNWVAYAYHDSIELNNYKEMNRDYIIHTGNQEESKTLFVENLTSFVPWDSALSKDGRTLVFTSHDAGEGFVTYNLFTNQSWVYTSGNQYQINSIVVDNDFVRFVELNTSKPEYMLKKMDLNTSEITLIKVLDVPDAISGFTVVGEYVFVMTNAERSNDILIYLGIPLIIVIVIYFRKKDHK